MNITQDLSMNHTEKGQYTFFTEEEGRAFTKALRDADCRKDTPLTHNACRMAGVYGQGKAICPFHDGKKQTAYEKKIYLPSLLPLEEYDRIIVLLSGGKDSIACTLKLLEMGTDGSGALLRDGQGKTVKDKMELWHHDIDGGAEKEMDWPVTKAYVRAFAGATGLPLRLSWRDGGFYGEIYRVGASYPVMYEDQGGIVTVPLTRKQKRSMELRAQLLRESLGETEKQAAARELQEYGFRRKWPAKNASLATRYCSSVLKIDVCGAVLRNLDACPELESLGARRRRFPSKADAHSGRWRSGALKAQVCSSVIADMPRSRNSRILIVSGERRGESVGRSRYNEMELHRANADSPKGTAHRTVHLWRPVIDCTERDVWEILKRHCVIPHPAYRLGWNRCSCLACIFSLPCHMAGLKELFPERYKMLRETEIDLNFTIDNKKNLDEYIEGAVSCVYHGDADAIRQATTGEYAPAEIFCPPGLWQFPAGAFHGAEGGPC